MQWFVDIAALLQPITLYLSLFGSLTASQINNVNFGLSIF